MDDVIVTGRVLKWGNSYGIRIRKSDLEEAGLSPGEEVDVRVVRKGERIDLSDLPTFNSGDSDVSERHDEYLGEAGLKELREKSQ